MEDSRIVELYQKRDRSAISESQERYGAYLKAIAVNILGSAQDAEECINDALMRAWESIPPQRPAKLGAFLGRIIRNLAIDRYRQERALKKGGGQTELCLEELEGCIGEGSSLEDRLVLREQLNSFLDALEEKNRELFMLRYWYMMPVKEIAKSCGQSEGAVKMSLKRTRDKLKNYLEKEGGTL